MFDLTHMGHDKAVKALHKAMIQTGFTQHRAVLTAIESLHEGNNPLEFLETRWYKSLQNGDPDFAVYEHPLYLAEAFYCWFVYSRQCLKEMSSIRRHPPRGFLHSLGTVNVIVDLGNGIGFSTAGFAKLYPSATIYGTNVADCDQMKIAKCIADPFETGTPSFQMVPDLKEIGATADIVFASEYFEHFEEPIAHLHEVLQYLKPRFLITCNGFGVDGIGHFIEYKDGENIVEGKKMSRLFNKEVQKYGYEKIDNNFWNHRPIVWRKI